MRRNLKLQLVATMLMFVLSPGFKTLANHQPDDQLATAKGKGTLKVGKEEFTISAVTVKLLENGKAEINLISEISIFVSGTWANGNVSSNEVDLKITEAAAGGFEGTGKLFFDADRKSIVRLSLQGSSRVSKRKIDVNFVADQGS